MTNLSLKFDEPPQVALVPDSKPLQINTLSMTDKRQLGAFYTPDVAVEFMADWIVRGDNEHILEPSFGDGAFLKAVVQRAITRKLHNLFLHGVEVDKNTHAVACGTLGLPNAELRCQDFLRVPPFKVHAVVGNPPYVRLRQLPPEQRDPALAAAQQVMGVTMEPSGSVWMPFVLHAMQFLHQGGRLAFVLPYDMTYVRYARPLWDVLSRRFGNIVVIRTHERIFTDILQDVIILLADDFGGSTNHVTYRTFNTGKDLLNGDVNTEEDITIDNVVDGERSFLVSLLKPDLRHLLDTKLRRALEPARKSVKFNIGYVAGDKTFFHPTRADVAEFRIPERSLYPTITSTRGLKQLGLYTSSIGEGKSERLFLPDPDRLTQGEQAYIAQGEADGVSNRYKCQVRQPWFVVPGTKVPDAVLSVFSERPVLMLNDGEYFASNSLLCGFMVAGTREELAARWYTTLTLLQCEIEVHSLGGGVMIVIPGEAGNIKLPKEVRIDAAHLQAVDSALKAGDTTGAYRAGDDFVLRCQLGLNEAEIELIRDGVDTLTYWRTSSRSSGQ